MVFFASNTILSCLFFFFLIIDLYFLIPAVIAQAFTTTSEIPIPSGKVTKEAKAVIEPHPVTTKSKIN